MASFRLVRPDLFPAGATVGAYPASNWATDVQPSGTAVGAATSAVVVAADGSATFAGLADGVRYYAGVSTGAGGYVSFVTPRASSADNGQAGLFGPTCRGWYFSAVIGANTVHKFYRFVPSRDMVVVSLGHVVTVVATVNDSVDLGLYDAAMNKIVSTGLTAGKCTATGAQSIAIAPTQLKAGIVYYFAHKYGAIGGTAATLLAATFGGTLTSRAFGSGAGVIEGGDMAGAAGDALPATLVIPGVSATSTYTAGILRET